MYLILFVTFLSTVTSDTCYTDLQFTLTAWKPSSSWVAKGSLDYNVSAGSNTINDGTTTVKQKQFALDVSVDQCSYNCRDGPFVKVSATAKKIPTKTLPGYDYHPGVGYYKYHTSPTHWDNAREICNNEGTHLAVINSEAEAQILGNYIATVPVNGSDFKDYANIGFHDRFVTGLYLTIFDQPLNETGFYRWASPFEPNNANGNEFCGSMHRNGGMNDVNCTISLAFICEQELC